LQIKLTAIYPAMQTGGHAVADTRFIVMLGLAGGINAAKTQPDGLFYQRRRAVFLPGRTVNNPGHPYPVSGNQKVVSVHKHSMKNIGLRLSSHIN